MPSLSAFDIFKIGIGPSSSHTMGPWQAARRFLDERTSAELARVNRLVVDLYGSLAKTGKGHGTDLAVQMGLLGADPRTVEVDSIPTELESIKASGRITANGVRQIAFDPQQDIVFHREIQLPGHPNGLRFTAILDDGSTIQSVYYSIGGGFIVREGEAEPTTAKAFPFPIECASDLLTHCRENNCSIAEIVMRNELVLRDATQIHTEIDAIRDAMLSSVHRGCRTAGTLPGGLNVKRRAFGVASSLLGHDCPEGATQWLDAIRQQPRDFQRVLDWVSCFALAVNEENAAFGRVVTAPTNGAAGVIPAVLMYHLCFNDPPPEASRRFLLTAAEIGCIFKKGATISAAMGGCQAEIGVSSAMAAAALTEGLGGTPPQAAMAAEIAMEHHLGMTCDPIGGLVQIPCIERNAFGAIKAITAAHLSLLTNPVEARVSLDDVVRTMWETAQDMNAKYKETSEGGLALRIAVNLSEC
ncbi:L-serine ammonia-lyase [Roseiconus nitratireducens]|uniref:L-serine dehydratase n=1 Tax=Roseiconus nitratireducens TaxID=2605748 RepID=A0A5M6D2M8_9BACT|nr:L-serine ammonia-lyase [Roseiconus nitratireducens]KAA5541738.1 L-serine ammonia-lyase [Roseiconus nitratireducens]